MKLDFKGKTALVTGASAGIGRELARELAAEVACVILVARRQERLDDLAAELRAKRADLCVLTRAVDISDRAAAGAMLDALDREGVGVDILINNAGFGDYGLFEQREWEKLEQMVELNVVSATFFLHRLIPLMVTRGFGAVLNVGSIAGMISAPAMATYGATKAYLNFLSESLRAELAGTGVVVTALCPGPVPTEFNEVAGDGPRPPVPSFAEVSAPACARAGLEGLRRGKARVIPGMVRAMAAIEALPKPFMRPLLARAGKQIRRM
jgi:uncharacterized protein